MNQTRRTALKQILLATAGAAVIPACLDNKAPTITLKQINITGAQEAMLMALSAAIIPTTTTPGAAETGATAFALKMVDDCYSKEDQDKFIKGLSTFEAFAREKSGTAFDSADAASQSAVLDAIEQHKEEDELGFFYKSMKQLTRRAYTTSKYFLTEVEHFKLVPGPVFKGCVPVQQA